MAMRPIITNFQSGILSSRFDGRIDLPLVAGGAKEITNFKVKPYGGVDRRGPLKMIYDLEATGNVRIIPWSVGDDLDVLIVLYAGKIKIFNVTYGTTFGWVSWDDGTGVMVDEITSLSTISTTATYTQTELNEVQYAQSISQIVLAHKNHRPFKIKVLSFDSATNEIIFEYGLVSFTGNIAYSKEYDVDATTSTVLSHSLFVSAMDALPLDTVIAASGIINGKNIVSIKKTQSTVGRMAHIYVQMSALFVILDTYEADIYDGTSAVMDSAFDGYVYGIGPARNVARFTFDGTIQRTAFLDLCATHLSDVGFYEIWDIGNLMHVVGTVSVKAASKSTSWTITFDDDSTLVITETPGTEMTGYISVSDYHIALNKQSIPGYDIINRTVPWMTPDITYFCTDDSIINGVQIISAIKIIDKVASPYTGNFMEIPTLRLVTINGDYINVTRDTADITGIIGVIVTPYYEASDNPGVVCYHQNRMVFGASDKEPNVFYASKINDLDNFSLFEEVEYSSTDLKPASEWADPGVPETVTTTDIVQQIGASSAIRFQLNTEESEAIRSMVSVSDLIISTSTSEWILPAIVDATNVRVQMTTRNGSSKVQARFVGNSVALVQRTGKGMKAYLPEGATQSPSMTDHASNIFSSKIQSFDFRQDPDSEIYTVMGDGTVNVGYVSQEIVAWSTIKTRSSDEIISLAVIADPEEDAVYVVVKRKTTTGDEYYLERLMTPDTSDFLTRTYLDHYMSGTAETTYIADAASFSQFDNTDLIMVLERDGVAYYGTMVLDLSGNATGITLPDLTVMNVEIGDKYCIGFKYLSRLKTFRIDSTSTEGLVKGVGGIHLRVYETGDFRLVNDIDTSYLQEVETPVDNDGDRIYPYTGAINTQYYSPNDTDQYVVLETDSHEPCGIQVIAPYISVAEVP